MNSYFIRLTFCYDRLAPFFEIMKEKCDVCVVYQHDDEDVNTHIHAYIEKCQVSTDTLKNYIRKVLCNNSNSRIERTQWSFKEAKDRNCITYMSKGRFDPKFVFGIEHDEIERFKSEWIQPKPKGMTMYVVKENAKESKQRQEDMLKEICDIVDKSDDQTPRFILSTIRQVVVIKNRTILGRFKARDYYDTVRCRTNKSQWLESMINFVREKEFL